MTSVTELHGPPHVERYIETDGEEGYRWRNDTKILLLFTKGRKSGEERINALIFESDGDDYLIVASKGGAAAPPGWLLNLEADAEVEVQIKGDRFKAHARIATAEEKPRMWEKMTAVWPNYVAYQESTDREIPVVVLERA
ncbi:MAG TPA: nitroreductase family deazaflavin-dependent oxidoreductase [Solirubrobacterales bacterium]|jgi:deazaflavin-dependent oxidoreductase (nitroreductase family)|nr:nitroreductase family deazaflavin-dependent oxidoreductase [Solirubrobacterales bacterium]